MFSRFLLHACVLVLLGAGAFKATAGRNPDPGVMPINSSPYGKTYGEWGAEWWKWALSFPIDQNPIMDPTGEFASQGQSGPVWFLAGTSGGTAERAVTIPAGKAIFFSMLNLINDYPCPDPNFQPAPGQTLEEFLTEGAAFFIDHTTVLFAEVDGVPLKNLFNYRATSGLFTFTGDPSLVSFDPCITGAPQQAVADGYWVMLAPLRRGAHTIRFGGTEEFPEFDFSFSVDVTFHITVE